MSTARKSVLAVASALLALGLSSCGTESQSVVEVSEAPAAVTTTSSAPTKPTKITFGDTVTAATGSKFTVSKPVAGPADAYGTWGPKSGALSVFTITYVNNTAGPKDVSMLSVKASRNGEVAKQYYSDDAAGYGYLFNAPKVQPGSTFTWKVAFDGKLDAAWVVEIDNSIAFTS